jgi:chemotaxis protein CheX
MTADLKSNISPGELAQIVESVFSTMLRLGVEECAEPWHAGENRLISLVHLAGEWNGAVLLECDQLQARHFTGRFLSRDPAERVDDVVRDTLAELANMIGGNMKCLLTGRTQLSMPSVMDGSDYSLRVCGAEVQLRVAFRCSEGVFWITLLGMRA